MVYYREERGDIMPKKTRVYNKLVRDKVPEAIVENGDAYSHYVIDNHTDYLFALDEKLDEELVEYQVTKDLNELADVLEVIHAIAEAKGATFEELDAIRLAKRERRGGFTKKIILEAIHEEA